MSDRLAEVTDIVAVSSTTSRRDGRLIVHLPDMDNPPNPKCLTEPKKSVWKHKSIDIYPQNHRKLCDHCREMLENL